MYMKGKANGLYLYITVEVLSLLTGPGHCTLYSAVTNKKNSKENKTFY